MIIEINKLLSALQYNYFFWPQWHLLKLIPSVILALLEFVPFLVHWKFLGSLTSLFKSATTFGSITLLISGGTHPKWVVRKVPARPRTKWHFLASWVWLSRFWVSAARGRWGHMAPNEGASRVGGDEGGTKIDMVSYCFELKDIFN